MLTLSQQKVSLFHLAAQDLKGLLFHDALILYIV